MLTIWRQSLTAAISIALAFPIASCAAEPSAASFVEREVVTLPFPGGTDIERLKQSHRDVVGLLRKRAAEEARDSKYQPQVSVYSVFPSDSSRPRIIIGAVTPRKGVFYVMPLGHYASLDDYNNGRIERKDKVDLCRMEMRWDRLPGGPIAPGLNWAGMYMSDLGCKPPPADQLAMLDEWKGRKAKPDYIVEDKVSAGEVSVTLIREVRPKAWAIPLIDDNWTASVVATRRGRLFAYFSDRIYAGDFQDLMCVADGLSWADIVAEPGLLGTETARRFCQDLMRQYSDRRSEEMQRINEKLPPPLSIPMTPRN
ncbi:MULTISPECIES: hypothetical protein [unclassified Sphingopyxis]|uniref:hypothetical protein n=1 Tax=unclassified Sphingopyxis TaxID=2614943 RepID=UPI00285D62C1|nr:MULTISPECIES: hypothetical protein [unclassified Sphingopyxis]MDR7061059.1 hypothetical protein [Sphingopyxis sp. BE235]MDR7181516.1 hypothetical protein [Sphingopyxis sp. BE249]